MFETMQTVLVVIKLSSLQPGAYSVFSVDQILQEIYAYADEFNIEIFSIISFGLSKAEISEDIIVGAMADYSPTRLYKH
jgi:hypothetical protein